MRKSMSSGSRLKSKPTFQENESTIFYSNKSSPSSSLGINSESSSRQTSMFKLNHGSDDCWFWCGIACTLFKMSDFINQNTRFAHNAYYKNTYFMWNVCKFCRKLWCWVDVGKKWRWQCRYHDTPSDSWVPSKVSALHYNLFDFHARIVRPRPSSAYNTVIL